MRAEYNTVGLVEPKASLEKAEDASALGLRDDVGEVSYSEWRIRFGPSAWAGADDNQQYSSTCFRDPHTGKSVISSEAYMTLMQGIGEYSNPAPCKFSLFLFPPIFVAGFLAPPNMFNVVWLITAFVVVRYCFPLVDEAGDSGIQEVIDKHRDEWLNAFGVELGCQLRSNENGKPHLWFRRPRRTQQDEHRPPFSIKNLPEAFPPIYVYFSVPGDIWVEDELYHPSVQMDKNTWTLIQKTHRGVFKDSLKPWKPLTMMMLALLYYLLFVAVIIPSLDHEWKWVIAVFYPLYLIMIPVPFIWSHIRLNRSLQTVVDTVNRVLQAREEGSTDDSTTSSTMDTRYGYIYNEDMVAYSLQFKTDPLFGRSYYYQLVRNLPNNTTAATGAAAIYETQEEQHGMELV